MAQQLVLGTVRPSVTQTPPNPSIVCNTGRGFWPKQSAHTSRRAEGGLSSKLQPQGSVMHAQSLPRLLVEHHAEAVWAAEAAV